MSGRKKRASKGEAGSTSYGSGRIGSGFALRFALQSAGLFLLAAALPESTFVWLGRHTAEMAARLLALGGYRPLLEGLILQQDGFSVRVITECSVLYMAILYGSFLFVWPASLRRRVIGALAGIPVLHAANVVRIALVFAVGVSWPGLFEPVHVYLGQVAMVLLVIAAAWVWTWTDSPRFPVFSGPARFLIRFLVVTAILFPVWLVVNVEYVRLTDHLVRGAFLVFGKQLRVSYQHAVYYQTFNMVTFVGLILAGRFPLDRRRLHLLVFGLVSIVGLHLAFRICNVLLMAFRNGPALKVCMAISLIGQYLVPVLFGLLMWRDEAGTKKKTVPINRLNTGSLLHHGHSIAQSGRQ